MMPPMAMAAAADRAKIGIVNIGTTMDGMGTETLRHLGIYSDLVAAAAAQRPLFVSAPSATEARRRARALLRFTLNDDRPQDVRREGAWEADGVAGEALSWSVGYGPRTQGWLLRPAGAKQKLPGLVALHDHGDFKFLGKEKIADGPDGAAAGVGPFRATYYGGRAFVNALAREGFAVLVHDVLLWGSRRFPLETMPDTERTLAPAIAGLLKPAADTPEAAAYNGAAYLHENLVAKYCTLLGTSFAALVAYEDRVAHALLRSRAEVIADRVGCIGLSGGGCRATLLAATAEHVAASVVVGMMTTYASLLDQHIACHTWMLFPPGLSAEGDWPDLAGAGAPAPLLVQYLLDDVLFTAAGMRAADRRIAGYYALSGAPESYRAEFYPGGHRFDVGMQESAFAWLKTQLG
jgi:dienelactone hydrolase